MDYSGPFCIWEVVCPRLARLGRIVRDEPYIYIRRFNIDKEELEKQPITVNNEEVWKLRNYKDFIKKDQ